MISRLNLLVHIYISICNCYNTQENLIEIDAIIDKINKSDDIELLDEAFFLVISNKKYLTELGLNNLDNIIEVTRLYLQDFKIEKGMGIRDYFNNRFDFWNLSKEDYKELENYIVGDEFKVYEGKIYNIRLKKYKELVKFHENRSKYKNEEIKELNNIIKFPKKYVLFKSNDFNNEKTYENYIISQVTYAKEKLLNLNYTKSYLFKGLPKKHINEYCYIFNKEVPQIITVAFESKKEEIIRKTENMFRDKNGIPRIGEGWVSETYLYMQIVKSFPNQLIIQHGRPNWLGRQHLDIYFPNNNIAIEYQGLQHDEPVDFFGGVEAFKKQQQRDKKKKILCEKNDCKLIYVYPEYNFQEIKNKITILLEIRT